MIITSAAIPLLSSLFGLGTLLVVYLLTWKAGRLPPNTMTPPISFLGCSSPEHEAYQIGFALTGAMLLSCLLVWKKVFQPSLREYGNFTGRLTLMGGYMAVVGVIGQGLVTLEENILENIKLGKGISQQSVCHQQLAGIFFLGAAMHCYTTIYYCYRAPNPIYGKKSIRVKLICVILSLVSWPIAELLHPARTGNLKNKRGFNVAGLAQYITVGSYILFFGSYSMDFRQAEIKQRESTRTTDSSSSSSSSGPSPSRSEKEKGL